MRDNLLQQIPYVADLELHDRIAHLGGVELLMASKQRRDHGEIICTSRHLKSVLLGNSSPDTRHTTDAC